ncbi:hypothetical protein VTH82DRAFT_7148 [Thermothelomyces myriococcoides]
MADVRALLRQQRAARRIEHPHASYTDTGKLICTVCNDYVKTESLWDGHLRSAGHRQRLQALHQASSKKTSNGYAGFVGQDSEIRGSVVPTSKRKLSDSDDDMDGEDETTRRKRTRPNSPSGGAPSHEAETPAKRDSNGKPDKPITPPLHRRASATPSIGVEMQIPSRPATPSASGTPMATTPKAPPIARTPLIPEETEAAQPEGSAGAHETQGGNAVTTGPAEPVDEDMWAAFEADLIHGSGTNAGTKPPPPPAAAATAAGLGDDAVISAPAMSAAEVAAKSEEEERTRRRALVDIQIEDEKEEATRALETEFEVMEELEARARKLRERREALRAQSNGGAAAGTATVATNSDSKDTPLGKENAGTGDEEDEENEDDEDDDDDWNGFRFRS